MTINPREILKKYTNARLVLGSAGNSLNTEEILKLRMAHAQARDAVYSEMDIEGLSSGFKRIGLETISVQSQASGKYNYLKNPQNGKLLDSKSIDILREEVKDKSDLCIITGDGLSAKAINDNAVKVVECLIPLLMNMKWTPVILAKYSRVALSDHIGEIMNSQITLILIGERPGLSSPASMGAYITFNPKLGNTDEKRNCVSNIHAEGLSNESAALKISWLVNQMVINKISGVQLKDDFMDYNAPGKIIKP